jgi:hypothetical protein
LETRAVKRPKNTTYIVRDEESLAEKQRGKRAAFKAADKKQWMSTQQTLATDYEE